MRGKGVSVLVVAVMLAAALTSLVQYAKGDEKIIIQGFVEDTHGNRLAGISVYLWDVGKGMNISEPCTTSSGGYYIFEVPRGRYEIRTNTSIVGDKIYLPALVKAEEYAEGVCWKNITVEGKKITAEVRIYVENYSGSLTVSLYNTDNNYTFYASKKGDYYEARVFNGNYTVSIVPTGAEARYWRCIENKITVNEKDAPISHTLTYENVVSGSVSVFVDGEEWDNYAYNESNNSIMVFGHIPMGSSVTVEYEYNTSISENKTVLSLPLLEGTKPVAHDAKDGVVKGINLAYLYIEAKHLFKNITLYHSVKKGPRNLTVPEDIPEGNTSFYVEKPPVKIIQWSLCKDEINDTAIEITYWNNDTKQSIQLNYNEKNPEDGDYTVDWEDGIVHLTHTYLSDGDAINLTHYYVWEEWADGIDYNYTTSGNVSEIKFSSILKDGEAVRADYEYYEDVTNNEYLIRQGPIYNVTVYKDGSRWNSTNNYTVDEKKGKIKMLRALVAPTTVNVSYEYNITEHTSETIISMAHVIVLDGPNYTMKKRVDKYSLYLFDNSTRTRLEEGTVVHVVLYDSAMAKIIDEYDKTDEPHYIEFYADDPSYFLIIDPDGYYAKTLKVGEIEDGDIIYFDREDKISRDEYRIDVQSDWNTIIVDRYLELSHDASIPFLGADIRNIWLQIDSLLGNGDGVVNSSEISALSSYLEYYGPENYVTDNVFTMNGVPYINSGHQYSVSSSADGLSMGICVCSGNNLTIHFRATYNSLEQISGEEHEITLKMRADEMMHGSLYDRVYKVIMPQGYQSDTPSWNEFDGTNVYVTFNPDTTWSDGEKRDIKIVSSEKPVAKAEVTAENMWAISNNTYVVRVGENITFSALSSTPGQEHDEIVNYAWDFGDGDTSDNATYTKSYSSAGEYSVQLLVTDSGGLTDTADVIIKVDSSPPSVVVTTDPAYMIINNTATIYVDEGQEIAFNATNSSDNYSEHNLTFSWDFGDGDIDEGAIVNHTYDAWGTYFINLSVTDGVGLSQNFTIKVIVNDTTPPVIRVGPTNITVTEGIEKIFSANNSYDPNSGEIVNYTWYFNDTGEYAYGSWAKHVFSHEGKYRVSVTLTDRAGNSATLNITVNVRIGARPDIEIVSVNIPGGIEAGKHCTINVVIRNNGTADAKGTIYVNITDSSGKVIGTSKINGLALGNETVVPVKVKFSSRGEHKINVAVSCSEEPQEFAENNEKSALSVHVAAPKWQRYALIGGGVAIIIILLILLAFRHRIAERLAEKREKGTEKKEKKEKKQEKKEKKKK